MNTMPLPYTFSYVSATSGKRFTSANRFATWDEAYEASKAHRLTFRSTYDYDVERVTLASWQ